MLGPSLLGLAEVPGDRIRAHEDRVHLLPANSTPATRLTFLMEQNGLRVSIQQHAVPALLGVRLQSRGQVHGVADAGVSGSLLGAGVGGRHFAGRNAYADADRLLRFSPAPSQTDS